MQHIIISRIDNMGDAVLASPMAALIKHKFPDCKVSFLGRSYVEDVISACPHFDSFINWDNLDVLPDADVIVHVSPNKKLARLAKKAGIKTRIGTRRRWFHLLNCNKLVSLSRRNSPLHECQLNLQLLAPLGIDPRMDLSDLVPLFQLNPQQALPEGVTALIDPKRFNLILHPGSNGRVWPADYFKQLIQSLDPEIFNIFLTGSGSEAQRFESSNITPCPQAHNLMGKLSIGQLLTLQKTCGGTVATSTGPVHTAAALGTHALGLYSPRATIDHKRWGPVGARAEHLSSDKICEPCQTGGGNYKSCECLAMISVAAVKKALMAWV